MNIFHKPVWLCRSALCTADSSRLPTEGTSRRDVRGKEGRRRRRTGRRGCGRRSSADRRPSGSSHRPPRSYESTGRYHSCFFLFFYKYTDTNDLFFEGVLGLTLSEETDSNIHKVSDDLISYSSISHSRHTQLFLKPGDFKVNICFVATPGWG